MTGPRKETVGDTKAPRVPDGSEVTGMVPVGSSNGNSCSQADFGLSAPDLNPELHSNGRRAGELKMRPHGFTLQALSVFLAAL